MKTLKTLNKTFLLQKKVQETYSTFKKRVLDYYFQRIGYVSIVDLKREENGAGGFKKESCVVYSEHRKIGGKLGTLLED